MTDVKELRKKRSSYKGRLTVFSTFLNKLQDSTVSPSQVMELQLRVNKLEDLYNEFNEIQLQLECMCEIDAEALERTSIESQYYELVAQAKVMLNKYSKSEQEEIKSTTSSKRQFIKLPTIQLPKFSGSYNSWLEFRDTFTSLIHGNDDIDEINKFHYLRSSLTESAAIVIQSIEFSAQNYNMAWELLCERFDNERLLIENHVTALFNIESITKESSTALKSIVDNVNKNIRALKTLGEPVDSWDTLLIYIIRQKLDTKTFREWEEYKGRIDKSKRITFDQFIEFMRNRAELIETLEKSRHSTNTHTNTKQNTKIKSFVTTENISSSLSRSCPKCKSDHNLNSCPQFLSLSVNDRMSLLPGYKLCYNCLRHGHYPSNCKKSGCKICKRKHHTLIHNSDYKPVSSKSPGTTDKASAESSSSADTNNNNHVALSANISAQSHTSSTGNILLSTALIRCYDVNNEEHIARALLDSGSSACLMTENLFNKLQLPYLNTNKSIQGINNSLSHIKKMCRVHIKSLHEFYSNDLTCFILPTITDNVPAKQVHVNIPSNIHLADPYFHTPASIDIIIGADVFWSLLGSDKVLLGDGKPTLYQTRLGWLVCGPINGGYDNNSINCNYVNDCCESSSSSSSNELTDIRNQLTRFWQLEEVGRDASTYSAEEQMCEEHFIKNTTRLSDGRFCVKIPLKASTDSLGDSYHRAKRCFLSLERRNHKQPSLDKMYKDFMTEYINLGHMSECHINENLQSYFIPHHGILRESSITTKLRVVFNASAPTTSGISLNAIQMVGPTVQDDLTAILLRFRMHKYVLSADVEKMYRQVSVHPSDRHLQQIIWRDNFNNTFKTYQLNTVTYGTASAPFLATRCIKQIGLECQDKKAAEAILHDFYVDDLLTGTDVFEEAQMLRHKVTDALASACMPLRKWKSNEPSLISESTDESYFEFHQPGDTCSKTLGLSWRTDTDDLFFPIKVPDCTVNTKRGMLAVIAQIYDPLGLLAPCVVSMKMLLQKLWLDKLEWDDHLSPDIAAIWANTIKNLPCIHNLRIARRVVCDAYKQFEFHIFTDASEQAYGACLYVRSINEQGDVDVRLFTAKSRIAPIKPLTIPRLELCAAVLGVRLYQKVVSHLHIQPSSVVFWTDSMIVLGWLKMLPIKLNTFVRNRVAEVLEISGTCGWRHVSTHDNPADLITRGVEPTAMQSLDLWWFGPCFLKCDSSTWPPISINTQNLPEVKPNNILVNLAQENHATGDLVKGVIEFNRFSNFSRLHRSICYVLRFINLCKRCSSINTSYFTAQELQDALNFIIIQSQKESFPEYNLLLNNKQLPYKNRLLNLNVFLDNNKIIRIGGRLHNSEYSYTKKHPILIQSTHHFAKLLFQFEHIRLMHAGPQLLLSTIRETYWPLGGRNLARACCRQCVRCQRVKPRTIAPQMGNLPLSRLSPADYPFQNVGVDYAGPIASASRQGRGCRLVKVYIVLFVCFTTKAIHLELVGDLTSNNYLQALRRFMSRRGKPLNIYSDNGTAFVGAYNEIAEFLKRNCDSISDSAAQDGITFHFIPAYAPHFGGLWEAGVKSTKYHLLRVLGNCNLTYEELNSILIQIEGILNSRPLTPLSSNPEDLLPLTPGHFLIGRPLTSLPVKDLRDHSTSHLTRHQRLEQLRQHFWTRWSKEYVSELQQRVKWRTGNDSLNLDTLVVIKEDNQPPMKWKLGRVVALHPGTDGISRVADIRTATGTVRRAFSKICPLLETSC